MNIVFGALALSPFRLDKLQQQIATIDCSLQLTAAQYIHFIQSDNNDLSEDELSLAKSLLHYGDHWPDQLPESDFKRISIPRFGTISPWSSKATDIFHHCGLEKVERVERGIVYYFQGDENACSTEVEALIHDRMIENVIRQEKQADSLFVHEKPKNLVEINLLNKGLEELVNANTQLGLALSQDEIDYLYHRFRELKRNPTDVELMMFAQANSEHCRHKIFNADWVIDGEQKQDSLFGMIRKSYQASPDAVLSAYHDNAAIQKGGKGLRFLVDPDTGKYHSVEEDIHFQIKVETHNHPTAISPFPGAATGSGGEIRDEGATGKGSKPKAGLAGFNVSNLSIPGFEQPWEKQFGKPDRIDSALNIMIEAPLGAAAFNNEFGRPNILGYFRTLEEQVNVGSKERLYGYHKPIMIAGGLGNIRPMHLHKDEIPHGAKIIVIGGPAMLIGLGGGAASSMASGSSHEALDFASVQRGNPEMERRCQEVIDQCNAMGEQSPILSIHDIGAGGLSNAVPEIINDCGRGGVFELRNIPNDEPSMSPMEIWCNESQERYVVAVAEENLQTFIDICQRERCIYAVLGTATKEQHIRLTDKLLGKDAIDLPLDVLFGKPPKMTRNVKHIDRTTQGFDTSALNLEESIKRVLRLPSVANKSFLITIGDRSITGMVHRDQMVGPWQVPVADVAVTTRDLFGYHGEAMSMGEKPLSAIANPEASGRMAVCEALTNMLAADVSLADVCLSANWMAPAGVEGEDAALFDTVKAVGEKLCPQLGIAIPVGKDSMSMKTVWEENGQNREMIGPLSLVITAFAKTNDVRRTLDPQLRTDQGKTTLLLIDLGKEQNRLGGSALAQVYNQVAQQTPDCDNPELIKLLYQFMAANREAVLAYHDRSDGGLLASILEMAFAGHCGVDLHINDEDLFAALFSEELGVVLQIKDSDKAEIQQQLQQFGLAAYTREIATLNEQMQFNIYHSGKAVYQQAISQLQQIWSQTSWQMQKLRDNPECADQEFALIKDSNQGIKTRLSFNPDDRPAILTSKPRMAILREQGVNGQLEMAAAFQKAGFETIDVHMSDLIDRDLSLDSFKGLVACGGFSYGDVLGAGGGWAKTILNHGKVRDQFEQFFNRNDTFALGVCNGCQMLSQLHELIPGADFWPSFQRNQSEQFEARFSSVRIGKSKSILLQGMEGSIFPIAVAHGEGRAVFHHNSKQAEDFIAMQYVDDKGEATQHYPLNPNGSELALAGISNRDGRVTIMMPHPERVYRTVQNSWHPDNWGENAPTMRIFDNARQWVA